MSKKRKKAQRGRQPLPQAWASNKQNNTEGVGEATEAAPAQEPAAAENRESGTLAEANQRLAEVSRVISIKEAKMAKSKGGKGKPGIATLPPLPKLKSGRMKPDNECECGCGGLTKSRFVPGHDSWQRGLIMRLERGLLDRAWVDENLPEGQKVALDEKIRQMKKDEAKKKRAGKAAKDAAAEAEAESDAVADELDEAANDD